MTLLEVVATRMKCKNNVQLKLMVETIINDNGEGVILRKEKSLYEPGRTPSLLKIKV